ncbi:D-fructose-6-phosphate amidotransferase [Parvularcula bermudensis HTCC2503]|uniref:Glutamine--fructose-6-phosphate aminotransferase [isomerizing] n=1 Tax=Parvularcula bermudensis (strain ATCC BAA-594 / HTCC2503 / KCTC 12087) TaxID=314260 RepID=E0TG17_PARBH|nr:glutamine--fructose-6-phosphate transaminase (isomerizing) [Parvularcula bermudensis]ADM10136.1 D-fructose-6-phosphate amidotransferase [Parvularcula bermudensis HTCC2503]
MCGIVGVIGLEDAAGALLEGLARLEYRGYDSAGVAVLNDDGIIHRRRATGKLAALREKMAAGPLEGDRGIGHTRWATHGRPSEENAHPHFGQGVAVVHNGIIENFATLRRELIEKGETFQSDTDTEVIAKWIGHDIAAGKDPKTSFADAVSRLQGAYALAVMVEADPDHLYFARRGSPLAIGRTEEAMFIGSDSQALAPFTRYVTYLADGDWGWIDRGRMTVFGADGAPVQREEKISSASAAIVEKGEYRHFMAKEIHQQPEVVGRALTGYIDAVEGRTVPIEDEIDFAAIDRLLISACGTAYYAGLVAKYWFETYARLPVETDIASELRYRDVVYPEKGAALFISQSGETADTLAALREAKAKGCHIGGVVNVPESTIAREADCLYPIQAGPEIGVASTKAFTCQLASLASIVVRAGVARGVIAPDEEVRLCRVLLEAPRQLAAILTQEASIAAVADHVAGARDVLYLGRGTSYPIALEGALKLKEISYIHAEGYAAGELKHGPIALIDERVPVIVIAPEDRHFEKTLSNMQEVLARGGRCILLSTAAGVARAQEGGDLTAAITLPAIDPLIAPILYAVPIQLMAYHAAVIKGTDVDQPRNLAKSVTVE